MTTLYRAAESDYIEQGASFATTRETADLYRSNPGFGGRSLYRAEADGGTIDLRGMSVAAAAELLGQPDPGSIGVDEWLPRTPAALDAARETGALWALVDESYPRGTTTWIWLGSALDDEPEMIEC